MNPLYWLRALRAWWKFREYRPIRVTPKLVGRWLKQFPAESRAELLSLLEGVRFLDERFITRALTEGNDRILERLRSDGLGLNRVIYVQYDDAGSSSPYMLHLLRDAARLERSGAVFLDSKDQMQLSKETAARNVGAIVFVDDFAGSGGQFTRNRAWMSKFVAGSFSEFLLSVVICEEAMGPIEDAGVVPICAITHKQAERPLHDSCMSFNAESRTKLMELGRTVDAKFPLGFRNLGTNIVLFRNAPNSTPVLLRGNPSQSPRFGVLPRTTDLPIAQ